MALVSQHICNQHKGTDHYETQRVDTQHNKTNNMSTLSIMIPSITAFNKMTLRITLNILKLDQLCLVSFY
jgi:hypothetical protein